MREVVATGYVSTRTKAASEPVPFEFALLQGIAPDGGLYVPAAVPTMDQEDVRRCRDIADAALAVLSRWIGDEIEADELSRITSDALDFPAPLIPLRGSYYRGIAILELFHGPTLSFKDFGARVMARLMSHFLRKQGRKLTILVATSGDTGSAVADGFAGQTDIDVVLLYPSGMVSEVQERQLIVQRPGVQTLEVEGTFDDCQRLVKEAFSDPELNALGLSSANSINIGRLLPQMVYYWWASVQRQIQSAVYCVPSGNLGNLTAGLMATLSGMPASRFIAAHNANDFFPRFLGGEDVSFGPTRRTISNAMDVGAPSNFERLSAVVKPGRLREMVWGTSVDDAATRRRMTHALDCTGYLADPHTAVGLEAVLRYRRETEDDSDVIVLATAHPAKFPEVIEHATGLVPHADALDALRDEDVNATRIDADLASLRRVLLDK